MEREILKDEPLTDLSTVATPRTSQLQVVGLGPGWTTKVGHPVMARVELKDQRGRAVLKGGHEVRIWMVDSKNHVRAAVDVTDLRNGTYVALLPVLWTGKMEVRAAVVRPREFRRTWLTLLDKMKMTNQIQAIFVSGGRKQVDVGRNVVAALRIDVWSVAVTALNRWHVGSAVSTMVLFINCNHEEH